MESGTTLRCAPILVIMDKYKIIEKVFDSLHSCIEDMMSDDFTKAAKADLRFQSLASGLYNLIKSL